jgi:hypothetical protein
MQYTPDMQDMQDTQGKLANPPLAPQARKAL